MAGNYGRQSKTRTAIAAYTPNVPWARFGEPAVVDFDGNGTSSATPQVAAAAALWIEKHRAQFDSYAEGWMRVEAVRKALFDSAAKGAAVDAEELGYGMLRVADALSQQAAPASRLAASAPDNANYRIAETVARRCSAGVRRDRRNEHVDVEARSRTGRRAPNPVSKP